MAWPKTGAGSVATGYLASGVTTIRWGSTDLVSTVNGVSCAAGVGVVTRFSQKQIVDTIRLPNGDGLTSTRVSIIDGVQWDVTIRDTTALVASAAQMQIGMGAVIVDAGGMITGTGSTGVGKTYACTIVDIQYEAAPKQAGERHLTVENLVLIESQAGS